MTELQRQGSNRMTRATNARSPAVVCFVALALAAVGCVPLADSDRLNEMNEVGPGGRQDGGPNVPDSATTDTEDAGAEDAGDRRDAGVQQDAAPTDSGIVPWQPSWASAAGEDAQGRRWLEFEVGSTTTRLMYLAPGTYTMGSPAGETGRDADEVEREVTLSQGFWMAETEATQALWQAVTDELPIHDPAHPIVNVNWNDVQTFLTTLNGLVPGLEARLPTEAEWEYACRGGTTGPRYGNIDDIAWYLPHQRPDNHPVRQKLPNDYGLYDMLGNVWEFCQDRFCLYDDMSVQDPFCAPNDAEPANRSLAVRRGGSIYHDTEDIRAAERFTLDITIAATNVGFRIVRGPL